MRLHTPVPVRAALATAVTAAVAVTPALLVDMRYPEDRPTSAD